MLLLQQSGWQDSNLRPPGPKPGALAKLSHTPLFFFIYLCFVVRRKTYYMLSNPKCQHLFSIFFDFFWKSDFLSLKKSLKPAKHKALRAFHFFRKNCFFLFAKRDFLLVFEIFFKKIFFSYNKKILTFFIFSSILLLSRICKKRYCRYPINNTSKIYSQMSQADIRNLRK